MNTETSLLDRLKLFMQYTGLSNSQFADVANIPRPTLSQLLHGRNKSVNDSLLRKLNDGFPNLNISWLLFGRGDMLLDGNSQFSTPQNGIKTIDSTPENSDLQSDSTLFTLKTESPTPLPKEISDAISNVVNPKTEKKTPTQAAEPYFYEVRPLQDPSDKSESGERVQNKKEAPCKKVTSILVIYSDGSCDTFTPGPLQPLRQ